MQLAVVRYLFFFAGLLLFPLAATAQNCQHVGAYPWTSNACLDPADFNNLAELSIGPAPPQNAYGQGARKGKPWLDTSVAPAVIRLCVIAPGNCSTSYVAAEWIDLTEVDFGAGLVDWPIGGGAVTVPSNALVDIGNFPQAVVTISGNTTITSFGTSLPVGRAKWVIFTGTPTLVNSANLILPGGTNITAQAGDAAAVLSVGGGNVQVLYQHTILASAGGKGLTLQSNGTMVADGGTALSFATGHLGAVVNTKGWFAKIPAASTVDNIVASAIEFTCSVNPIVTVYECGTSATCSASPVTIGSATLTTSGAAVNGTVSNPAITAGDYVGFAISAGTCTALNVSAQVQLHSN